MKLKKLFLSVLSVSALSGALVFVGPVRPAVAWDNGGDQWGWRHPEHNPHCMGNPWDKDEPKCKKPPKCEGWGWMGDGRCKPKCGDGDHDRDDRRCKPPPKCGDGDHDWDDLHCKPKSP